MKPEEATRFVAAMLQFIERVAQKEATAEEVEALPAVAQVLAEWDKAV